MFVLGLHLQIKYLEPTSKKKVLVLVYSLGIRVHWMSVPLARQNTVAKWNMADQRGFTHGGWVSKKLRKAQDPNILFIETLQ